MSGKLITILSLIISSILIILFTTLGIKWPMTLFVFLPLIIALITYIGFTSYAIDKCRNPANKCKWEDAYKYLYKLIKSNL